MFKKTLLSFILSSILIGINSPLNSAEYFNANELRETQAFSEGFQLAITGVKQKEFKLQGYKNETIQFDEFIVVVDSTGLDDAKKFLIQSFGFKYFDSVRLSNEWIVLGSFAQRPNAELLMESLNNKWFKVLDKSRQAFIHQNAKNTTYTKAKSFHSDIAEIIEEDINKNKKILYVEKTLPVEPMEINESPTKKMQVENIPQNQNLSRKIPLNQQIQPEIKKNTPIVLNKEVVPSKKEVKENPIVKKFDDLEIKSPQKTKEEEERIKNLVNPTIYEIILKEPAALTYKNISSKSKQIPLASIIEVGSYENTGSTYISDKKITDVNGKAYYKILNKDILLREDDIILAKESKL